MIITESFLWVEKYRPQKIDDCILPDTLQDTFNAIVASGELQNLLLSGGSGCGKTTVAKALCNELDMDWMIINCSEDGNIDTLRTKIREFASTVSLTGNKKAVILDEFDYSNPQSMQPALRGFIEEFADNCRFIMTCNFKNRIIEPLKSRCTNIDFKFTKSDKAKVSGKFLSRLQYILNNENIEYDDKVLAKLIIRYGTDFRRIINELQRYSVSGKIDNGILVNLGETNIEDLFSSMKTKNFSQVRKWVFDNLDNDITQILHKIYENLNDNFSSTSIPQAILILADYQYKSAFVTDQEINLTACLVQLMIECEFK
jgi:DNA polymerase III delta prime subunit